MRHLMSPLDLSVEELDKVLDLANDIEENPEKFAHVADGKKLATCFYEPSTRTRLSFESAMLGLGGSVLGFASADSVFCGQGRERSRYRQNRGLLCGHHRDATSKRRCAYGSGRQIAGADHQCGRRRTPASDSDSDRSADDSFGERPSGRSDYRAVRRSEVRPYGALSDFGSDSL